MNGRMRAARLIGAIALTTLAAPLLAQHDATQRAATESRREEWQKVDDVLKAMGTKPGAVVADIGAGGGFFTARLSRAVGKSGRVYAVDVSARVLMNLKQRVAEEQLANVEVIEGAADDPKLPAGALDAVLIVNAYHEMNEHHAMLTKIKASLKPDGRLVILEPIAPSRRDSARADQIRTHEIAVDYVQKEAREAGFWVMTLQDPFTSRFNARDDEWLLVLTPASSVSPTPPAAAAPAATPPTAKEDEWKAPELRIGVDEFKKLAAANNVLVVDVRDPESFRDGHLPGAELIMIEDIAAGKGTERLRGERRPIVTYCS
jgi:ubiquinone/menaquinone biosynthesis C-methylase UbiE